MERGLPPRRLAWAREGAANDAMVSAITAVVVRKDVFTKTPEIKGEEMLGRRTRARV